MPCFPSGLFLSSLPTKILSAFLLSPKRTAFPSHHHPRFTHPNNMKMSDDRPDDGSSRHLWNVFQQSIFQNTRRNIPEQSSSYRRQNLKSHALDSQTCYDSLKTPMLGSWARFLRNKIPGYSYYPGKSALLAYRIGDDCAGLSWPGLLWGKKKIATLLLGFDPRKPDATPESWRKGLIDVWIYRLVQAALTRVFHNDDTTRQHTATTLTQLHPPQLYILHYLLKLRNQQGQILPPHK
jgi:hypothetical protein